MLDIHIKTIPHGKQNYPTVGDYSKTGHRRDIVVSEMKNRKYELLVAIHELIEQALCEDRGITDAEITDFDKRFEAERELGLHALDEEPGFDPYAPYMKEHAFATKIERMLARELDVNWDEYDRTVTTR